MAVRLKDVALSRNAKWELELQLWQDAKRTTPLPLAGYGVSSQLRMSESRSSYLLADIKAEIVDADTGKIRLSLSRAKIGAIPASEGWADVLVGPVGADPDRVCCFRAEIGDGVTA